MVVTAMSAPPRRGLCGGLRRYSAHRGGRGLDRFDDVHVARAATEVALEALSNLVIGRTRVLRQQIGGRHDHPGRAVAALEAMLVPERLLQRMELAVLGHPFDRGQALAFGLDREHGAALHRLAVDEDRAGPALAGVASDMGTRKAGDVPYVVHEQKPGLDLILVPAAVDGSGDLVVHTVPPNPGEGARSAGGQQKLAETVSPNCATFTPELQLENSFPVAAPPERVFAYLLDVNKVAGCVPGAELSEVVDPSTFKGKVKIKVGPITVAYNGTARIVDRDDSTHSASIEAEGRETTGPGSARATAHMSVVADGAGSTVKIVTEYNVAGRVAQFGRGVMEDVSRRLVGEMAACIAANIEAEEPHSAASANPSSSSSTQAPAQAPATPKPVNAFGLLFSVLWARLRGLLGSKS